MQSDGRVIISTALDNTGFKKGVAGLPNQLGGLQSTLKKIGAAVGIAFGVKALYNFGKSAIELGSNVAEVQNVVDTAFGDMAYKVEEFAKTSIENFGMSKLSAKKTASTYMAMARGMGMAEGQASDMAISLAGMTGDVASFFNISQELADTKLKSVFTGETESLKDLGVVMTQTNLKAYALSQGITKDISAMSQAELVSLRYGFVMNQLALANGDFAKTSDSWANQTRILSERWKEFMSIIGQALITVLTPVIKALNTIVAGLINMANTFNNVVTAIFGGASKQIEAAQANAQGVESAIGGSVANQEQLTDAVKATNKAAKGAVATFDDLNVLSKADTGNGTGNASGDGYLIPMPSGRDAQETVSPFIQSIMDALIPLQAINFDNLTSAFERLKEAIEPITQSIFDGLKWAYDNLFIPLATWTIESFLPSFLDSLAGVCKVLSSALGTLKPLGLWLWNNFLKPIAQWTSGVVVSVLDGMADSLKKVSDWIANHQGLVEGMTLTVGSFFAVWKGMEIAEFIINAGGLAKIIGGITTALKACTLAKMADKWESMQLIGLYAKDFVISIASGVAALATSTAAWVAETAAKAASTVAMWAQTAATTAWNTIGATATAVTTGFSIALNSVCWPVLAVIAAIGALIAIVVLLIKNWDKVKAAATLCWEGIKNVWNTVAAWFDTNVVQPVAAFFTGLWDGIKNAFISVWDFMSGAFKGYINGWLDLIEGFANFFVNMINKIIDALNTISIDIPDWVPEFGGSTFGINIPNVSKISIPRLARGAVIPANSEFLAVLGDQKSGRNLEAPEGLIRKIVREETSGQSVTVQVVADGNAKEFVRWLRFELSKEDTRRGVNLIKGGAFT